MLMSVLIHPTVTKRFLFSVQIAGGEFKHDNREDGDDEDDGYERRSSPEASQPSSRCFVTLCCESAHSWTWQAPAQTNILFVFGVFVLLYINYVLAKWAMYQTAAQTNILAGQNR